MAELDQLKRKRGAIKHKVTNFSKHVKVLSDAFENNQEIPQNSILELQVRFDKFSDLLSEFEETQIQIEYSCSHESLAVEYVERDNFMEAYASNFANAKVILDKHNQQNNNRDDRSVTPHESRKVPDNIKLPTISLPKFDSNYTKWLEYKDLFESLINSNDSISAIQKYHYLRASLEGDAKKVIESLEFSAPNYSVAWNLLCDRFNNTKLLIHNHIKSIFEIESLTGETSHGIRNLVDTILKHLRSLETLKQPIHSWDVLIIFIIGSKLDRSTAREWEKLKIATDVPKLTDMINFLKGRADWLETLEINHDPKKNSVKDKHKVQKQVTLLTSSKRQCNYCKNESHLIYTCEDFLKLDIPLRITKVNELNLCKNCLRTGHSHKVCKHGSCRTCHKKHNSLLHNGDVDKKPNQSNNLAVSTQVSLSSFSHFPHVLLSTAIVSLQNSQGNMCDARILLDSGSQSNFIAAELCKRLSLKQQPTNISIGGINSINSILDRKCDVTIKSRINNFSVTISCLVLPRITEKLPLHNFTIETWNIPKNIDLADPNFNESRDISLLIGAGHFWDVLRSGKVQLSKSLPILHNSVFGWIVSGTMSDTCSQSHCHFLQESSLETNLKRFWETEECSEPIKSSDDDTACENYFKDTISRNSEGRFIVRIPLKHSPSELGDSKQVAIKRLLQLEKRFNRNPAFKEQYSKFMKEYQDLNHMTLVGNDCNNLDLSYFLPHHGVIRKESLSTKLRVVYDGSAPSSSGWSVNDLQFIGPNIYTELFTILLQFRQHPVAVCADVEKMYRQIIVHQDDRFLQRILWRENQSDQISIYSLNTVTYGTSSAPYLAVRCLRELSQNVKHEFPYAAKIIAQNFYVDDLIVSFENEIQAIKTCHQISKVLKSACFPLRKWSSNSQSILKEFEDKEDPISIVSFSSDNQIKTLGIIWNNQTDTFSYHVPDQINRTTISKRIILSEISKIFDPLGLLGPCTILTKILIQRLWLLRLGWDDPIPQELQTQWLRFIQNITALNKLEIKRHVSQVNAIKFELHGFCDASQKAYAASIYLRTIDDKNNVQTSLLVAKTKVAPLKILTIPRLELCSAVILARLTKKVVESLTFNVKCFLWSDSQVVLHWIHTEPRLLQIFVANRISEIQSITDISSWNYVNTKENPCDLASRGTYPELLPKNQLWWSGPVWLSQLIYNVPKPLVTQLEMPEMRKNIISFVTTKTYCLRFTSNARKCKGERNFGPLSVQELHTSIKTLVKLAQWEHFSHEIEQLQATQGLTRTKLSSLAIFLDSEGLLRVGGRLRKSDLPYNAKHPLLLSGKHPLTKLIFEYQHKALLHAGPQLLLATVRQNYWATSGMNLAKKIVRSCITCFKFKPSSQNPIMADLPANRVTVTNPFNTTGVDYAGPFTLRDRKGRGCKFVKGYICVFICFISKAVHLEVVTDLTTQSFLSVLRRFVSRRGKPSHIHSDNGTNFVGTKKELAILYKFLQNSNDAIMECCATDNIIWHFNPPSAPHFGGLWESAVKSAKHHLYRVLKDTKLTYEEFNTVLVQVEATLNSRPLYPFSPDPNDLQPLTPAHFLIGRPLTTVPDPDLAHIPLGKLSRAQLLQTLLQGFWKRWSTEYLSQMQQRSKWKHTTAPMKIGTLVLIKQDNLPPCSWAMGRVIQTHPGEDQSVRVVTIKTAKGVIKRAVTKVCALPLPNNELNS